MRLLACWFWKITEVVGHSPKNVDVRKVCGRELISDAQPCPLSDNGSATASKMSEVTLKGSKLVEVICLCISAQPLGNLKPSYPSNGHC